MKKRERARETKREGKGLVLIQQIDRSSKALLKKRIFIFLINQQR